MHVTTVDTTYLILYKVICVFIIVVTVVNEYVYMYIYHVSEDICQSDTRCTKSLFVRACVRRRLF